MTQDNENLGERHSREPQMTGLSSELSTEVSGELMALNQSEEIVVAAIQFFFAVVASYIFVCFSPYAQENCKCKSEYH